MSFHPTLPIAATPAAVQAGGALAFHRETGKFQKDRLDLGGSPLPPETTISAVRFSADGRNLILSCRDPSSGDWYLRRVKLRLSAAESAALGKPPKRAPAQAPAPAPGKRAKPKQNKAGADRA